MRIARLFAALAAAMLLIAPAVPGQDAKDDAAKQKEKDKAAKAKPPARSYSDDDLKKYKDKPKEESTESQGQTESTSEPALPEGTNRRRRNNESGGAQAAPQGTQASRTQASRSESTDVPEAASPEEADWRRRAAQARRPLQEAEANVRQIEAQIADLRDQLNPMSTKYVLGGNSTAGPGAVYEIEEKLRNLEGELVSARATVAEAQKTWQAFLEEARAGGASPAWLNP